MEMTEMVAAIVAMGCGTGIAAWFMICVRDVLLRRGAKAPDGTLEEIRALRGEIQALRKENHDLVLGFDNTLQQLDRRLDRAEDQRVLPGDYAATRERAAELTVGVRSGS